MHKKAAIQLMHINHIREIFPHNFQNKRFIQVQKRALTLEDCQNAVFCRTEHLACAICNRFLMKGWIL